MLESHVLVYFWHEAISTANYLTNRLPTKTYNHKTPLETLEYFTTIPTYHSLPTRVFGRVVYVHLRKSRNKLEPRAVKCVFVGYGTNQKGYRCFNPVNNRVYTTMDCDFFESTYYFDHLSRQGESSNDYLTRLTYSQELDHDVTEQVGVPPVVTPERSIQFFSPHMPSPVITLSSKHPNMEEKEHELLEYLLVNLYFQVLLIILCRKLNFATI